MLFPAAAWAGFISSNFRRIPILRDARVLKTLDHRRTTSDSNGQRGCTVHRRVATEVYTAIHPESPHGQLWILLSLRTLKCERAFPQISRHVSLSTRKHLLKELLALVGEQRRDCGIAFAQA